MKTLIYSLTALSIIICIAFVLSFGVSSLDIPLAVVVATIIGGLACSVGSYVLIKKSQPTVGLRIVAWINIVTSIVLVLILCVIYLIVHAKFPIMG